MYANVVEEEFQAKTPARENILWFTWGRPVLANLSVWARMAIFVLAVCSVEIVLVAFWFLLAKNEAYGWVFLTTTPPLLFFGANLTVLRGVISPYYGHMYKYDTIMLLALRWAVEVSILTSIHALMPESLDNQSLVNFGDGLSFVLGATMAVVSGRDNTWLLHLLLQTDVSRWTLTLLCLAGGTFVVLIDVHISVFLVGNIYLDTQAMGHKPNEALACSIATVVQLGCVGSIWASHKFKCWMDRKCKTQ